MPKVYWGKPVKPASSFRTSMSPKLLHSGTCLLRGSSLGWPNFMYSHVTLHQQLYPLLDTDGKAFQLIYQTVPGSINILLKIAALPEIMKVASSDLMLFKIQNGGNTCYFLDIVFFQFKLSVLCKM